MLTLVAIALLGAVSPVQRAEQLYQQARYEDALKALGRDCSGGSVRESELVACEKVRAFALVALGRESEARAAFDRLIVHSPDVDLGADVSPKLQALFNAAKREIAQVMSLALEPVTPGISTAGSSVPWPLSVRTPGDVYLDALHVFVAAASTSRFTDVTMRSQGGVWVGMYEPQAEPSAPRYYLVATLSSGVTIGIGDPGASRAVVVNAATSSGRDPMNLDDINPPSDAPNAIAATRRSGDDSKILGLPPWAFWTVVGGTVVATAVIVFAVTRGGGSESPGAVHVGLTFQ